MIQEREDHRPPKWGHFGGSIEKGETPLQAVIRETKEELDLDISKSDLEYIGVFKDSVQAGYKGIVEEDFDVECHVFIYRKDLDPNSLNIKEGKAAKYMSPEEVRKVFEEYSIKADVEVVETVRKALK